MPPQQTKCSPGFGCRYGGSLPPTDGVWGAATLSSRVHSIPSYRLCATVCVATAFFQGLLACALQSTTPGAPAIALPPGAILRPTQCLVGAGPAAAVPGGLNRGPVPWTSSVCVVSDVAVFATAVLGSDVAFMHRIGRWVVLDGVATSSALLAHRVVSLCHKLCAIPGSGSKKDGSNNRSTTNEPPNGNASPLHLLARGPWVAALLTLVSQLSKLTGGVTVATPSPQRRSAGCDAVGEAGDARCVPLPQRKVCYMHDHPLRIRDTACVYCVRYEL
jgi:hypothetical protein